MSAAPKPAAQRKNQSTSSATPKRAAPIKNVVELPAGQPVLPVIDIGINLTNSRFRSDLDQILKRSEEAGLKHLIITGTSEKASKDALALCLKTNRDKSHTPKLWCTVGVHPHDAKQFDFEKTPKLMEKLLNEGSVVAVGECGLDFNRMFSPQDVQEKVFARQIEIAVATKKPLFLHERDAHESFIKILKQYKSQLTAPVVVHCFTGSLEQVKEYLEMDFYIGLTGFICDTREGRGKHLEAVAAHIPLDRLMIETDGPFICPRNLPRRLSGKGRCEPWHITWVLARLAECRGVDVASEEFVNMTQQLYRNTINVFGLEAKDE